MSSCSTWDVPCASMTWRAAWSTSWGSRVRDANNPDGDIEIEYTGLRTAEKLFEELLIGSNVTGTDHPMIMRAMEHRLPWPRMQQVLNDLLVALASFDCHRALALLAESVAEYQAERGYPRLRLDAQGGAAARAGGQGRRFRRQATAVGGRQAQGQNPVGMTRAEG